MPDCKNIEAIKIATKEFVEEKIIPDTLNGFNQYVNENLELSTLNDPTILLTDEQLRQRNAEIALNKWKTEEHDKVRENYTNIENMESMYPISQAMRNQINTRHEAFRYTDNFERDCNANANRSINSPMDTGSIALSANHRDKESTNNININNSMIYEVRVSNLHIKFLTHESEVEVIDISRVLS